MQQTCAPLLVGYNVLSQNKHTQTVNIITPVRAHTCTHQTATLEAETTTTSNTADSPTKVASSETHQDSSHSTAVLSLEEEMAKCTLKNTTKQTILHVTTSAT